MYAIRSYYGCSLLLSLSPLANAAVGPYVSGSIGAAWASDSDLGNLYIPEFPGATATITSDTGMGLGIAGGYDFGGNRVEAELAYQKNDLDQLEASWSGISGAVDLSGDTSSLALLVNGYHDFQNASAFTPFIGAGIGVAKVELNDFNFVDSGLPDSSSDDTVFAYQLGAGISYAVNQQVNLDLKYRYFATQDPEFDGVDAEYSYNFV